MRTTKLLTAVVVGLALLYSAGCDSCQSYYEYPVYNCPPGYQAPVVYEGCPPLRAARKPRKVRYARRTQRFARTGQPCVYVAADGTRVYQDLGTATLVNDPGYVPTVMVGSEGSVAPMMVAAPAPVVVQAEPAPRTRVVYRRGRVQKRGKQARVLAPVYDAQPYAAPVYTAPTYYVSEPTAAEPALLEPAVVEPVVAAEPVEVAPEEPTYAEFLAPEEEAPAEPVVAEVEAEPAVVVATAEPQPISQDLFTIPADAVPAVMPPIMPAAPAPQLAQAYPYPVQSQQDASAMNTQQLQQLYQQRLAQLQELSLAIYQQQMSEQAGYQAGYQAPIVSEHMYAMAGPVNSGFDPNTFGSGYCPPEVCPVPVPIVCAPGQNLSECFTMNEYQMLNSPQVYTPEAMRPLPIAVQPSVMPSTALINPSAPPVPTAPIAPAAPAARQIPVAAPAPAAPVAPAAPAVAPTQTVAAPGGTSKYEALVPPVDLGRQQQNPPSVTMPAPLGSRPGSTTPPIAGTTEIENALDAMLARDPANPSMLK